MRIAALVPYRTDTVAGQRFRIETWARLLAPRGIEVDFFPFASQALTEVLYQNGRHLQKTLAMMGCYVDQLSRVLIAKKPDIVFIYREAALIGPAFIERLTRRWRAPIIYDIDEPLFVPYASPRNPILSRLRFQSKIRKLMEMSDHVFAVNQAIAKYAAEAAPRVSIVPMAADTDRYSPGKAPESPLRVGWAGTRTSQKNLDLLAEPMARLGKSHGASLRVIADEPMTLPDVNLDFIPWAFDSEVGQLRECLIGVVPIQRDEWCEWKFYFKLVQFMSLGLPVIATPIGSNLEIVEDGKNGFFADSPDEWYARLVQLAGDPAMRARLGKAARETVLARFSMAGQVDFLERVFRGDEAAMAREAAS
jgi:glycosyltransferase involved in cell wall biosynthesis